MREMKRDLVGQTRLTRSPERRRPVDARVGKRPLPSEREEVALLGMGRKTEGAFRQG